jgi:hypothetical protein
MLLTPLKLAKEFYSIQKQIYESQGLQMPDFDPESNEGKLLIESCSHLLTRLELYYA